MTQQTSNWVREGVVTFKLEEGRVHVNQQEMVRYTEPEIARNR